MHHKAARSSGSTVPQEAGDAAAPAPVASPPFRLPSGPIPSPQPASSFRGTRTLAFLLLLLFCNLQGDGFHLGGATPLAFQLRLLPLTLLFLSLLLATLFPDQLARRLPPALTRPFSGWRAPLASATLLLGLAIPLVLAEAHLYARFGYHLHPALTALVFTLSLVAVAAPLLRPHPAAGRLLLTTSAVLTAVSTLFIRSFPLALGRSDMLPLLLAANQTLLHGTNPYRLYTFPSETVALTYLPGTLLAFLPAALLHLDLRLTDLAALLLLALTVFRLARPSHRLRAASLLAAFLLGPYLLYRHELYTEPHWLVLTAALLLAGSGRLALASLLFGLGVAMSQFSWVLAPFFLLFILQSRGPRAAAGSLGLILLPAALLVIPFLLADPHSFLAGTFAHWSHIGLTARPVNLSFFTAALLGPSHLALAQGAVLLALLAVALRTRACRTLPGTLRLMVLALAAFVLLNLLVWGYFFLLIELLLLLHLLASEDAFAPAASHS